ncbi:MAG: BrnT family toxin [Tepidiformaceae bacterium]
MVYTDPDFEWDDTNEEHLARHGVSPDEAEQAAFDQQRYVYPAAAGRERRFIAIGSTDAGRLLAVVFTRRGERIRIVTSRSPNKWEERRYRRRK